ncbi:hypothetical protein [Acinetobacter sp. ANC 4648]|uniref:hypothetical protein n=1 Tax=Acinetobacter sp. ANC 4648 TaxID=1977875 RepID=UPI000B552095|nr:hypothetical protein [Acinetobacter sp. ANC 4648]OTG83732.1 peptide signal protein [Acinetobacter sp. ANC 4648]
MKKYLAITALFFTLSNVTNAESTTKTDVAANTQATPICLVEGIPSTDQFRSIKRIKVAKGTYGSVVELYPRFATSARKLGADVVVNYNGSQRFGFWPWRIVRPVVWGTAVKWNTTVDCNALGGKEIH